MRRSNFHTHRTPLEKAVIFGALVLSLFFLALLNGGASVQPRDLTASIIGCWLGDCNVDVSSYAPGCSISVTPSNVSPGTPVTLAWGSNIISPYLTPDYGKVLATSSVQFSAGNSNTYTLYDHAGAYSWLRYWLYYVLGLSTPVPYCSATLQVSSSPAGPTCLISVFPTTIVAGDPTSLYYSISGTFSSASIQGVGQAPMPPVTYTVRPNSTTDYKLSVSGPGGNYKCDTTVLVNPAPTTPTLYLEASPLRVQKGKPVIVAWSGKNVSSCALKDSTGATLSTALQNPIPAPTFTVTGPTTFTLTCNPSSGAPISKSVSITMVPWIEEI